MERELTGQEAASHLGIHPNTLAQWETQLGLKVEMGSNRRKRYTPEIVALLEQVKAFRGDDAGFNTIRRRLDIAPPGDSHEDPQGLSEAQVVHYVPQVDQVATQGLLDLIKVKDVELARLHEHYQAEIAKLNERLTATSTVAAQYQERASNLGEQMKLLTSGEPEKRPLWKFWQ